MNSLPPVDELIEVMAEKLRPMLARDGLDRVTVVGIHTGGAWVARALQQRLGITAEAGTLDISFYRDDFSRIGIHPQVRRSRLPHTIEDRVILLVDDVLHTGRTIRAAMNELFDYGRPSAIRLAVLVDRGGRELPIAPDASGLDVELGPSEQIKLDGPEPMNLAIRAVQP